MRDARRQSAALSEIAHRPWGLPRRPWLMGQTWRTLLFAHWPVPVERLARVVPARLPLDRFEGSAWVGVTPFLVSGLRLRGTPPIPRISRFPELNVRTYVSVAGKPGIYFLSLDAANRSAVAAARRAYRLPYFHAEMERSTRGAEVEFSSRRVSGDGPPAGFQATYRPTGKASAAQAGSLEHFLTERYCLYTLDDHGTVMRGEIHHPPWPLQPAEAGVARNGMADPFDLQLTGLPLLHFSARQDVVIWRLEPVDD